MAHAVPRSGSSVHVAIVGAGVIGLSVAARLVELPEDLVVTVIAEKLSPRTTSELSGGFVVPPRLEHESGAASMATTKGRVEATFRRLQKLYNSPECKEVGVTLVHGYYIGSTDSPGPPWWEHVVFGFRRADKFELAMLPEQDQPVYAFSSYMLQCRTYIPWLMRQFKKRGGIVVQAKVNNLSDLSNFDIIINCSGLAAAQLAEDPKVYPAAGQLVSVRAPWVSHFYLAHNNHAYIFPHVCSVILGTTFKPNETSIEVDSDETADILKHCQDIAPSLSGAEIIDTWVGIRPMRRDGMRLEKEVGTSNPVVVHCYGHGTQAMALSWGCAEEIARIVMDCAVQKTFTSKL